MMAPALRALGVYLLILCVASGVANVVAGPPTPLPEHIPAPIAAAWYWLLILGGGVTLAGVWWRDPLMGALIARPGLFMLGCGTYAYALVLGRTLDGRALFAAALIAGLGVAAHAGVWEISRWLKPLKGRRRA